MLSLSQLLQVSEPIKVFLHEPDFSQQLLGLGPDTDLEYESSVFRKLQDALLECREKQTLESQASVVQLNQAILNCTFVNFPRVSTNMMKAYAEQLEYDIREFVEYERELEQDDQEYEWGSESESEDNDLGSYNDQEDEEGRSVQDNISMFSEEEINNRRQT